VEGVEPQTETVWRQGDKYEVPRIVFVNKMDRTGADFFGCIQMVKDRLLAKPVAVQIPLGKEDNFVGVIDLITMKAIIYRDETLGADHETAEIPPELVAQAREYRERMVESVCETDDELLEKYLSGEFISAGDLKAGLRRGALSLALVPVLCGAAFKNKGVQPLLDAVVDYLPSPTDLPPVVGTDREGREEIVRQSRDQEPFSALVFKIMTDPYVGQLAFFPGLLRCPQDRLLRLQFNQGQPGTCGPPAEDACRQAGGNPGGLRRRYRCRSGFEGGDYRRYHLRGRCAGDSGVHGIPGPGNGRGH
jgi:elongation factor G